jgi:HAE1 family hydrophobic/amphiphilic exporter-1
MKLARFFIDRPVFAAVLSIAITLVGAIAALRLPIAEYPEIAPPTVQVTAAYPGASAETIAQTVAGPIEQEVNGVDGMLYLSSQSTGDGRVTISVVFRQGTNVDQAQVLVQNRVAVAEPRLPEEVRRLGITVKKASPDLLMVVHLTSPDGSRSPEYVSNYGTLNIKDRIARLDGVGDAIMFGARDYAMRVWLDPDRLAARGLAPGEVVDALRRANAQVAAGAIGQAPRAAEAGAFEISVQALGRLTSPEQFDEQVVGTGTNGAPIRLRDVARTEIGAADYSINALLNNRNAVAIGVFQRPGSNALATAEAIKRTMEEASRTFPSGIGYSIVYDTTRFIAQSMRAVVTTFVEAILLVVLVVVLFLQNWRAAIIPLLAIPVSIIGTFAVLLAMGFTLNSLTMFGLILAIGIVVDDAIVVVENAERHMADGLSPLEAARKTMDEVGFALIAIALVLVAVFVPTAFISGISGDFYRQFAATISVATLLSALVSLTLSPALAARLLKPHGHQAKRSVIFAPIGLFFRGFNWVFDRLSFGYGSLTRKLVRLPVILLLIYGGLLAWTGQTVLGTPTGLIPQMDRSYFIVAFQLPPGASLSRTDEVVRRASDTILATPGVESSVAFVGFDGATFTNAPNTGVVFATLKPFDERAKMGLTANSILGQLSGRLMSDGDAQVLVIPPPPVPGIGTGGGFKLMIQDRAGRGPQELERAVWGVLGQANGTPGIAFAFSLYNTSTPQIRADIDRTRAEMLGVPISRVHEALGTYMGSAFVNDFNLLGRTWRVTAQADMQHRMDVEDLARIRTRTDGGQMVPLGSIATFHETSGPYRMPRYNLYPAAEVQGAALPGVSTGQAIAAMEEVLKNLPEGFSYEWTELALQERIAGNTAPIAFGMAVVFVFLVLAAMYESWLLPLAVVLIAPMSVLAALLGVGFSGLDNNVLVQVGLVVLVGLAAKNAILIVEFARAAEEAGATRWEAAAAAARTRLRPILMTSLAFILGVLPLTVATGAGAEMRQSLGVAVFYGMLGVTIFGLLFTPVFYVVARALARRGGARPAAVPVAAE